MKLPIYQVDAFANQVFEGNPAAICPLNQWLPDELMQTIALENNLSETAFFVPQEEGYHIRWFTPASEVDLCGHATLASAFTLFNHLGYKKDQIQFFSKSGLLTVCRDGQWLEMDFPAQPPLVYNAPDKLLAAFTQKPKTCLKATDYILVFEHEEQVKQASPDLHALSSLDLRGVCITAQAQHYDMVCRFFAPKHGINEDPVTGSAFTQLVPYWAEVLGKTLINARQVSARGGDVRCQLIGDRVKIAGKAILYMEGILDLPDH